MNLKNRYFLLIIPGLILLIFLLWQLSGGLHLDLLQVETQSLINSFREEGSIYPQVQDILYAPGSQKVLALPVQDGQIVRQGDTVVILETQDLDFQLSQLYNQYHQGVEAQRNLLKKTQLSMKEAEIQFNALQKDWQKTLSLYEAGAIAQQELLEMENKKNLAEIYFEQTKKDVNMAEISPELATLDSQIKLLEYQIDQSTITAPIDGLVANLDLKIGEKVLAEQPLLTIFQEGDFLIESYVLEKDAFMLAQGMEVLLHLERNTETNIWPAQIQNIGSAIHPKLSPLGLTEDRVRITIGFAASKEIQLLPGGKLDVEFITWRQDNVLAVPKTALFSYKGQDALWMVKNNKAHIQTITKGQENHQSVIIKAGLEEGDQIIANPQAKGLKPGKRIKKSKSRA